MSNGPTTWVPATHMGDLVPGSWLFPTPAAAAIWGLKKWVNNSFLHASFPKSLSLYISNGFLKNTNIKHTALHSCYDHILNPIWAELLTLTAQSGNPARYLIQTQADLLVGETVTRTWGHCTPGRSPESQALWRRWVPRRVAMKSSIPDLQKCIS